MTPGTTHYPGCWREHHGCAVARVEDLVALVDAITDDMAARDWTEWRERVTAAVGLIR